MDLPEVYAKSTDEFDRRVQTIEGSQWGDATPCSEWDVRTLVNHVHGENLWLPSMLEGKTIEEVGDRFDGDQLGDDPKGAWKRAVTEAQEAARQPGVLERTVHLSFGDFPGDFYISQVVTDHVIHSWDLAKGLGHDDQIDPELVDFVYDFLAPQAEQWRAAGAFGPSPEVPEDADKQTRLLAMTGRKA